MGCETSHLANFAATNVIFRSRLHGRARDGAGVQSGSVNFEVPYSCARPVVLFYGPVHNETVEGDRMVERGRLNDSDEVRASPHPVGAPRHRTVEAGAQAWSVA